MNMPSRKQLKGYARDRLTGSWRFFVKAALLMLLFQFALQELLSMVFPSVSVSLASTPYFLSTLIIGMMTEILSVGALGLHMNLCRERDFTLRDLAKGFLYRPERILFWLLAMSSVSLFLALVPSSLSMILLYRRSVNVQLYLQVASISVFGALLVYLLQLPFAMVPFLYMDDPRKTTRDLMRESAQLMKGKKAKYFILQLSFLGMQLLGMLSFGFGMLWVKPYKAMTKTQFYLYACSIRRTQESSGQNSL